MVLGHLPPHPIVSHERTHTSEEAIAPEASILARERTNATRGARDADRREPIGQVMQIRSPRGGYGFVATLRYRILGRVH